MLKSLLIKNYALIDELTVQFSNGLVIMTGETGAGKSIIIDALSLLLGTRANAEAVRSGAEKAIVEGVFHVAGNKKLAALLEEQKIECADELIVRREVSSKGQSRCFLDDTPVTLQLQKQIGEMLVDLHGQHEHQSLLRVETHIDMLDDFGGLDGMVDEFRTALDRLRSLSRQLADLQQREQQLREKRDFFLFQMQEIDAVGPQPGEEEHLVRERTILDNAEKLYGVTGHLHELLYGGEESVHDHLVVARNQLQDLADIDKEFVEAARECGSAEAIVSELAKFIQGYNARVEFNPERLEELRERLGRLALLKKKYGGSLESIIAHRQTIGQEVSLAENFDVVIEQLRQEVEAARSECAAVAQRLSAKRHDVARKIDKSILAELSKVGIHHARFTTKIQQEEIAAGPGPDGADTRLSVTVGNTKVALNARGYDDVEFYITTNLGEEEKPLVRVASGGEVSRVMLALKSIVAKSDRLPVLIFDEIDVGVSGRIAQAVGLSLKNLAAFHQVVAITHLPQIAGLADEHFVVFKTETGGRTATSMRKLSLEDQVREVAKLMSGAEVTEAGLEGARELMGLQ